MTALDLSFVTDAATQWVREQREVFRSRALPLSGADVELMRQYFSRDVLDIAAVTSGTVTNPSFLAELRSGIPNVPDFSLMFGMTFDDTVVLSPNLLTTEAQRRSTLFHELVHVAQYRRLGVSSFMRQYVASWAREGYRYDRIVLELHAYGLEREFVCSPAPFSVADRLSMLMTCIT